LSSGLSPACVEPWDLMLVASLLALVAADRADLVFDQDRIFEGIVSV
jgi:hypothetical protein